MPLAPRRVLKQFKYAMYFGGVDDVIITPPPIPSSTQNFTWVFWISLADTISDRGIMQFVFQNGQFRTSYHRYGAVVVEAQTPYGYTAGIGGFPFQYLEWTHWVVKVDYTNLKDYAYRNGALFGAGSIDRTRWDALGSLLRVEIARGYFCSPWLGYIAQVLIYSRALSDSEILWNYLYPDNPVRNGLVLWLKADPQYVKDIDGDGVLEWLDLSGFGNHGKIYGAQLVQLVRDHARVLKPARVLSPVR